MTADRVVGVDYRILRSKQYRLQAESDRCAAEADRLLAAEFGENAPEFSAASLKSSENSERLAIEYDRMADGLDAALANARGSKS